MRYEFGHDYFEARHGRTAPICLETERLINAHVLLIGSSGVGKSHTIRTMIAQGHASAPGVRFHVFDVHGDLDISGASVAQFSEQAPFGLNPLVVNPDPDFGGVRKAVQAFLRTVNQASVTALGVKQESVLRNLLFDVYRDFGFDAERAETWSVNAYDTRPVSGVSDNRLYLVVPIAEKDQAKAYGARWDAEKKLWWVRTEDYRGELTRWPPAFKSRTYPTVADVAAYARRLHQERFLGSDQRAVAALGQVNRMARALQRKFLEEMRARHREEFDDEAVTALDAARGKAIEAYTDYVRAVRTGHEFETLLKYDSPDVLKSVVDRLGNLQATGLFKNTPAPFDPARAVWRYKLNALSQEEKKMLVLFLLQGIFNAAVQRGEQADVVEVVVLDELSTYLGPQSDQGDGVLGTISREARKFGLALWAANQSPANLPESLVSSVGTKVVLGLDEMYWNAAVAKLRMDAKLLAWIQPHRTLAVQMKEKGALKTRWWWVQLPEAPRAASR
jgi:DNA helicase HerA-like ATPase